MPVKPIALRVEHHESGFAIGHSTPRLSWSFTAGDADKDWTQTGYELEIHRYRDGNQQVESYKVASKQSNLVPWPSSPLASREQAQIRVRAVGTDNQQSPWTTFLDVEVALLVQQDWTAQMVSCPPQSNQHPKQPIRIRKTFPCPTSTSNARLYVTAHGLYEIALNGHRVGDQCLTPGWQSYRHHLNYQTYDVAGLLNTTSENTIEATIAEGWYAGRMSTPGIRNVFGDRLGLLAQIEVNGHVICQTDQTWRYFKTPGPILDSQIYDGETVDTRLTNDQHTVNTSNKNSTTAAVEIIPFPTALLISSDAPPVRRIKELSVQQIITTPSGARVLDFGQNMVGWVRINKQFKRSSGHDRILIRHAEVLENGELGVRPLRLAKACDTVILGGNTQDWEPKFTFHGFR